MGKGDTPRKVKKDKYDSNFESIEWKSKQTKEDQDDNSQRKN